MTTKRNTRRPEASKPTAKRRHVSDFEAETYYKYYAHGFDIREVAEQQDKTPKWWRRLGL